MWFSALLYRLWILTFVMTALTCRFGNRRSPTRGGGNVFMALSLVDSAQGMG
jgi:hypothetical protein